MSDQSNHAMLSKRAHAAMFCDGCGCLLTAADDEAGECTQCRTSLPPLRRLLFKIANSCYDDYITSKLHDAQLIRWFELNLGDVRLAWRLLR